MASLTLTLNLHTKILNVLMFGASMTLTFMITSCHERISDLKNVEIQGHHIF